MSPARFPLVAFDGTVSEYDKYGYNPGLIEGSEADVDAVTKARKYREKMRAGSPCSEDQNLYSDRRCLVGVRPLDDGDVHESHMKDRDGLAGRLPNTLPSAEGELTNGSGSQSRNTAGAIGWGVGDDRVWGVVQGRGVVVNLWEATAVTVVLAVVSLWFAFRRLRNGKTAVSPPILKGQGKEKLFVGDVDQPKSGVGAGVDANPAGSVTPNAETTGTPRPPPENLKLPQSDGNGTAQNGTPIFSTDGEDSEGDVPVTPGKRKARRGKRGKKKKMGLTLPGGDDVGDDGVGNVSGNGNSTNGNGNGSGEGLPETPPASSLVVNSSRLPVPATSSLIVSDTILGKIIHITPSISAF